MVDLGVFEAIKIGLQTEKEGLTMFLKFAQDTESISGKNMFIRLALDEVEHILNLENMAAELYEQGDIEGNFFEGLSQSSVNGEELEKNITETSKVEDLEAIALAIQQEMKAIEHYTMCVQVAQSELERKTYEHLMTMEKTHLLILEAERDRIKGSGHWIDFREFSPEEE